LILALDVYLRHNPSHASKTHPDVLELRNVLRCLPLHPRRPRPERFHNPSGVYMKLCNFLRFDPDYHGKGPQAGPQGEETVWNEFACDCERLRRGRPTDRAGLARR
jgi:5-methylcytosine-specific restriction protein A